MNLLDLIKKRLSSLEKINWNKIIIRFGIGLFLLLGLVTLSVFAIYPVGIKSILLWILWFALGLAVPFAITVGLLILFFRPKGQKSGPSSEPNNEKGWQKERRNYGSGLKKAMGYLPWKTALVLGIVTFTVWSFAHRPGTRLNPIVLECGPGDDWHDLSSFGETWFVVQPNAKCWTKWVNRPLDARAFLSSPTSEIRSRIGGREDGEIVSEGKDNPRRRSINRTATGFQYFNETRDPVLIRITTQPIPNF